MSSTYRYTRTPRRLAALLTVLALLAARPVALSSSRESARTTTTPATGMALPTGVVKAWGWNDRGQLGTGNPSYSHTPLPVHGLSDAVAIAAGERFALALRRDGTVWGWGESDALPLDNIPACATDRGDFCVMRPQRIPGLTHIVAIAASAGGGDENGALALEADGTVWA
jgi:hypothetical protein